MVLGTLKLLRAAAFASLGFALACSSAVTGSGRARAQGATASLDARALDAQTKRDVTDIHELAFDAFVDEILRVHGRPGAVVAVTKDGSVVWKRGYGFADVAHAIPMDPDHTLFLGASLSKPVLTVAVLMVLEDLARTTKVTLDWLLDRDVDVLLAAPDARVLHVRNPHHPDAPISLRMLLAHVSGIHDHYGLVAHHVPVSGPAFAHPAIDPLRDVIADYTDPSGRFFEGKDFGLDAPGESVSYSSIAFSIAGLVVEAQTGMPFERFVQERIFIPLGMNDTAWRLAEVPRAQTGALTLALPYRHGGDGPTLVEPSIWENVFYPSASLRTTAVDYARFASALESSLRGDGTLLAKQASMEMTRTQFPLAAPGRTLGLLRTQRGQSTVVVHGGANDGYRHEAFFSLNPALGVAGVVMTNGDDETNGMAEPMIVSEIMAALESGAFPISVSP